jgi:hypothetical protein
MTGAPCMIATCLLVPMLGNMSLRQASFGARFEYGHFLAFYALVLSAPGGYVQCLVAGRNTQ